MTQSSYKLRWSEATLDASHVLVSRAILKTLEVTRGVREKQNARGRQGGKVPNIICNWSVVHFGTSYSSSGQ